MTEAKSFHVQGGQPRPGAWSRERIEREHQRAEELRARLQGVDQADAVTVNRRAVAELIRRERADDGG